MRVPDAGIGGILSAIHARHLPDRTGKVADLLAEVAGTDPDGFGIAVSTAGGELHVAGDAEQEFTIQSVSKAFTYCLALELVGRKALLERVGLEPSGDPFNAIEFDPGTNRPFNPMVNSGAIAVSGMIRNEAGEGAFELILDRLSQAAGRRLRVDEAVHRAESENTDRNLAIGHLLRNVGSLDQPVNETVDLYSRHCSVLASAVDLARMGATLANLGENPVTGMRVFQPEAVRDTLSVMFTCGTYDFSGTWAVDVGVPAKSGIGGGICGVVNRQLGIGTFSPRLDDKGNSVRGVAAFRDLAHELSLHVFDRSNAGSPRQQAPGG